MQIHTIVDENIPLARDIFIQFGKVTLINGRNILQNDLKNSQNLIIRSVTKVDKMLLKNTSIKFVGTCTIGEDHVNKEELKELGIKFHSAPGCNAQSVAEYIISSLLKYSDNRNISLHGKSIGIIGVGNVGKLVNKYAQSLGMITVLNDPPRQRQEKDSVFDSFEKVLQCDFITLHVPLNENGSDKTLHLFNKNVFEKMNSEAVLINSCRGSVVKSDDLKYALGKKLIKDAIIDVWENEPTIDKELFDLCFIGTPHIAGYSYDAKIRGATMIANELATFMKVPAQDFSSLIKSDNIKLEVKMHDGDNMLDTLKKVTELLYNPLEDHFNLNKALNSLEPKKSFDDLRKNYKKRREFHIYPIYVNQNNRIHELQKFMSLFNIVLKTE